jgi:oligosaccharide repeat unit polymerase
MTALITVCYLVVAFSTGALLIFRKRGFIINPASLFLIAQTLMFVGTVPMIEEGSAADRKYLLILLVALIFTCAGISYSLFLEPASIERNNAWFNAPVSVIESGKRVNILVYSIIAVSVIASFLYYNAVGYNLFLLSIGNLLTGGANGPANDMNTMRLEAYADLDNYFAPGYVNQFKNLLLPCMLAFVAARRPYLKRSKAELLVLIIVVPLSLIFILGTGQRFPTVMACACAGSFLFYAVPRKLGKRVLVAITVVATVLFLAGTLILGRGGESENSSFGALAADAASRFTGSNQETGLVGFRFIQQRPITWGADYYYRIARIVRILPGGRRDLTMIDNEVYAYQYGTDRGTAPMHIWGESWYNFGWLGVTLLPFGMGFLYQRVHLRMLHGPKTLTRLLVYAYFSIILGTWAAAGPDYLLDKGLFTVVILSLLFRVTLSGKNPESRPIQSSAGECTAY